MILKFTRKKTKTFSAEHHSVTTLIHNNSIKYKIYLQASHITILKQLNTTSPNSPNVMELTQDVGAYQMSLLKAWTRDLKHFSNIWRRALPNISNILRRALPIKSGVSCEGSTPWIRLNLFDIRGFRSLPKSLKLQLGGTLYKVWLKINCQLSSSEQTHV